MKFIEKNIEYQKVLFDNPKRSQVLALSNEFKEIKKVFIHRNEAIENVLSLAKKYFEISGTTLDLVYGDYDESLLYTEKVESDLDIVFFNLDRVLLEEDSLNSWFFSRIEKLRLVSKRTLVIYYSLTPKATKLDAYLKNKDLIHIYNLEHLLGQREIFDISREKFTGSILSSRIHMKLAELVGGRLISDALDMHIKAVIFDLDNTLYGGVIGEDGVHGVNLESRIELHKLIIDLKQKGILLGICSKNDLAIVEELFAVRKTEFGFDLKDFTATSIGWDAKSIGVKKIAQKMRISESSIIFVDDNFSELLDVYSSSLLKKVVYASDDVGSLVKTLINFPGVWRSRTRSEDLLRHDDLVASQKREEISHLSDDEYFNQLEMKVKFCVNDTDIQRCTELSNKTNQYNLSFRRFSSSMIENFIENPRKKVITVSLEDKITDSGKIGLLLFESLGSDLHLVELCISCRALGRKLEDLFLLEILERVFPETQNLILDYKYGDRNQPLYNWLSKYFQFNRTDDQKLVIPARELLKDYIKPNVNINFEEKNDGY